MPTKVQAVDVPVQPREGAPRPCSSRPYSKRTKNFDPKEDVVIVSAWLNVSKDPVHEDNQSRASFWSWIHAYFEKHKKTEAFRMESSIMHRWMTILVQVNKFCACYETIERRNQSGATIQDKVCYPIWFICFVFYSFVKIYTLTINNMCRFLKHARCSRD